MSGNAEVENSKSLIYGWLLEEGFKVESRVDPSASFNFSVELPGGRGLTVLQPIASQDKILIATNVLLRPDDQSKINIMQRETREELLWNLRFGLLNMNIAFDPIALPLAKITLIKPIYMDGLNKNMFMNALLEVQRALLFSMMSIERAMGSPAPSTNLNYIY